MLVIFSCINANNLKAVTMQSGNSIDCCEEVSGIAVSFQVRAGVELPAGNGTKKVAQGLKVICTSLQQSRRLDLQLRGRAGRQGDPGETHMLLDLDDPNMETFALPFKGLFGGAGESECCRR